jgi:mono/diheme cytochrome c family protein
VEKLCVQAGISLACTLLTVVCLGVVVYAPDTHELLDPLLHGREVFEQNCIMCHGADAKGTGQLVAALPVRPANLTDCKLTAEDPVGVVQGIIRAWGTVNPNIGPTESGLAIRSFL